MATATVNKTFSQFATEATDSELRIYAQHCTDIQLLDGTLTFVNPNGNGYIRHEFDEFDEYAGIHFTADEIALESPDESAWVFSPSFSSWAVTEYAKKPCLVNTFSSQKIQLVSPLGCKDYTWNRTILSDSAAERVGQMMLSAL